MVMAKVILLETPEKIRVFFSDDSGKELIYYEDVGTKEPIAVTTWKDLVVNAQREAVRIAELIENNDIRNLEIYSSYKVLLTCFIITERIIKHIGTVSDLVEEVEKHKDSLFRNITLFYCKYIKNKGLYMRIKNINDNFYKEAYPLLRDLVKKPSTSLLRQLQSIYEVFHKSTEK